MALNWCHRILTPFWCQYIFKRLTDNHGMAKQDDYIRITARIPPEVHDALVELAKKSERSLNGELVARLQIAIAMAEEELPQPQTAVRQNEEKYNIEDPVEALIELIKAMPKNKQYALLELLKQ